MTSLNKATEEIPPARAQLSDQEKAALSKNGVSLGELIAKGSYGSVFKGTYKSPGREGVVVVAIKILDLTATSEKEEYTKTKFFSRELAAEKTLMTSMEHKYILKIYNVLFLGTIGVIIQEYAPNGTLQEVVAKTKLPEPQAGKWFGQAALGLFYIKSQFGIAHRDIKLENILLDKDHNAKLADFGFSKVSYDDTGKVVLAKTFCGTPPYFAPEVLESQLSKRAGKGAIHYDPFLVDVWALGVVLFAMTTQHLPFVFNKGMEVQLSQALKGRYQRGTYEALSEDLRDIIDGMLEPEPRERFHLTDVLKHPWCKKYREHFSISSASGGVKSFQSVHPKITPSSPPPIAPPSASKQPDSVQNPPMPKDMAKPVVVPSPAIAQKTPSPTTTTTNKSANQSHDQVSKKTASPVVVKYPAPPNLSKAPADNMKK